MYQASAKYIEQMMHRGTRRRLSGTVGDVPFTGADIVKDSFSITARASEESNTKIGGVYVGEVEMTFLPSFLTKVPRTAFQGQELTIYIGLWIPDEEDDIDGGDWEDIPCGVFTLQAPKISKAGITVSGFDHMKKLDAKINIDTTSATPYGYLTIIKNNCGVTLGQTEEEIQALPNGTELMGLYSENDIETYRDLLYWLAQACGCFATADRFGNIVMRKFGADNNIEIDENHRDVDVVFSGYTTKWTGIYITDIENQTAIYYGLEEDDGLTMSLGANPLLQLGTVFAIERRRRNVLNAIAEIQYTPFYINSARDAIFDLGDEIRFTGGISGEVTGVIMSLAYSLDNYTFEGFGDDPALTDAKTKSDKNISGLIQSTTENQVTFYNFVNGEELTIEPEVETTVASLAFTSAQTTTVKILHEFLMDIIGDMAKGGAYEVRYYYDNQLLPYKPFERISGIEQLTEGDDTEMSITRDFFYILKEVEPNIRHTWDVKIIAHDVESITIGQEHAHVTIEGQRLFGEEYFDGFIEAQDDIEIIPLGYLIPAGITDGVTITDDIESRAESVSDIIGLIDISSMTIFPISEAVEIYRETFGLAAEDGAQLLTEDGIRFIIE